MVSALSGGGKTTLKNSFLAKYAQSFDYSISYTTRKPRATEVDGVDYHFLTNHEFEQKIEQQQFLEYAQVHDNYYGTGIELLTTIENGRNMIMDVDVQGGIAIKKEAS